MSDYRVNNNLIKSRDIIPPSNRVKELADPYNPSQSITPTTELLIEFLSAVMTKDYKLALRYCTEILNREPDNLTALDFYPLIVEKLEMIENEELDSSSSDSSVSSSSATSSTSSSENKLSQDEFIDKASSLNEWGVSCTSFAEHTTQEKIDEGGVPSRNAPKKESKNENIKMEYKISLGARPKKTSLPKAEQCKKNRRETPPPENLLIHPTQTLTLISNNTSNKGAKTLSRPKQERGTPHILQQQPPSKILLHTTQTVTFPKKVSIQNSERTGNPQ